MSNLILLTDSYKVSHHVQYPPKTEKVYSYFESRGGCFGEVVFFGLQYLLKKYLSKPVTTDDVVEATALYAQHFGSRDVFNADGWLRLVQKHGGRLPVQIKAVAEGTPVAPGNVLMTVENTDDEFPWLTNWLETLLSQVWYPSTVATLSREFKRTFLRYLEDTGDPDLIGFKVHDFGFRGVSSVESAAIGGAAHLINFFGSDTVAGISMLKEFYRGGVCGFSIPASEHSTITSWGKDAEVDAFRNMVEQFGDGAFYACVSDSYDVFDATDRLWGQELRELVLSKKGTLVVRPDSGDFRKIVPRLLDTLGERFGYTVNAKGYKVLNPKVRLIQGDGIDIDTLGDLLWHVTTHGWSADNVAVGSGGGLLQKVNRDTCKFAFKCSNVTVQGQEREVFKDPVTDPGKVSKRGRLGLYKNFLRDGQWMFVTGSASDHAPHYNHWDQLETVFRNGALKKEFTLDMVRKNAAFNPLYISRDWVEAARERVA